MAKGSAYIATVVRANFSVNKLYAVAISDVLLIFSD